MVISVPDLSRGQTTRETASISPPPLDYRSGDTASDEKISQGVLVFGELPQPGLDDTLSPVKELVDLQKLDGPGIISQARQQVLASLQNLRKVQIVQHFQSLSQPQSSSR